ncbi:MAG: hypothetical protein E6K53_09920 [Gammaproteobacteria bacterium]|nr:MAG: hypothetical protein E6K53_09920 [Gammaproteobacteria bacterium]
MTRWQHEKCKAMRRVGDDEGRQLSLAQARQEIEDLIVNEMKEFRHAHRKRRARFKEKDPMLATSKAEPNLNTQDANDSPGEDLSDLLPDEGSPVADLDSYVI